MNNLVNLPDFKPSMDLAKKILRHVKIESIHLLEFSAKKDPEMDSMNEVEFTVQTKNEIQTLYYQEARLILASIKVSATGTFNDKELLRIEGTYRAFYKVDAEYTDDDIDNAAHSFAHFNSLPHVWSYWREFCSQATVRMGMAPFMLPLLVVGQPSQAQQGPETQKP